MAKLGGGATEGFSFDTTPANVGASKVDDECISATNSIDYIGIPQASEYAPRIACIGVMREDRRVGHFRLAYHTSIAKSVNVRKCT